MKIEPRDIADFLAAPAPGCVAILIYGPEAGLVSERSRTLRETVLGDPPDPMGLTDLTGDALTADPARLAVEADSPSLLGDRRLIRLRDIEGRAVSTVTGWLKQARPGGNLCYITSSVFADENETQIYAFGDRHAGWSLLSAGEVWQDLYGFDKPQPWSADLNCVTLTPRTTGTDGFFFAVMQRAAA